MTTMEVKLRDVEELLICHSCNATPMLPPVYMCRSGHAVCANCSRRLQHRSCLECEEPISGRNLPLEDVLMSLLHCIPLDPRILQNNTTNEEGEEKAECVLPEEAKESYRAVVEATRVAAAELSRIVAQDCSDQMKTSGRTVVCPFPCNIRVTESGLYRHFGFQHPEVYVGMPCKNLPFPVYIPYDRFAQLTNEKPTRCLYFLVVKIGDEEDNEEDKMSDNQCVKAADLLNMTHSMRYMLHRRRYLALLSISRLKNPEAYAVWVTALYDFSPIKYTLRYSNGFNTFTYQDRPVSLHQPPPTATGGGCLILNSSAIRRNLHSNSNSVDLTLVFHMDLPFPQNLPIDPEQPSIPVGILVDV